MHSIHSVSELGIGQDNRVLVVMPHPDDEAVFASGWIQSVVGVGASIKVITCTRGEKSTLRYGVADSADLATVRFQEQVRAFQILGVSDYEIWQFPDGGLEEHFSQLGQSLRAVFEQYHPTDILVLEPDGVYGHPDHIALTAVVLRCRPDATNIWYLTVAPWHQSPSARAMAKKAVIQPLQPDFRLWLSPSQILGKIKALLAHHSQFQLLPWQGNTFWRFWKNSLWWSEFLVQMDTKKPT